MKLKVPCTYQGGKQRIASQIVDLLIQNSDEQSVFYDLCCGSGAISIELINRGISPNRICMLDISSWGTFWNSIGTGSFNLDSFKEYISGLPKNKKEYKEYCHKLSLNPVTDNEAELYPILQANSFGGKQISFINNHWHNACFRDYWEPTPTSTRRSPANPMQPSPEELVRRIEVLCENMRGVKCIHNDISSIFQETITCHDIVYIDPPYRDTTGYLYGFDIMNLIDAFLSKFQAKLFISENNKLSDNAVRINMRGANGGISGTRKNKHEEWLSLF